MAYYKVFLLFDIIKSAEEVLAEQKLNEMEVFYNGIFKRKEASDY